MADEKAGEPAEIRWTYWETFLRYTPPHTTMRIWKFGGVKPTPTRSHNRFLLTEPDIELHCSSNPCQGVRRFATLRQETLDLWENGIVKSGELLLKYQCANCNSNQKIIAVRFEELVYDDSTKEHRPLVTKIGEWPRFGAPIPARVITLVGGDKDNFIKGYQCENQGLGIGAFAYYRRVIESQKGRLLDNIIKVAERNYAPQNAIDRLKDAKAEIQFKKAMESISDCVPESLLIKGHNPLTLLHRPLSIGIHDGDEKWCLEHATAIREVLFALADRIDVALKNSGELDKAVSRLIKPDDVVQ